MSAICHSTTRAPMAKPTARNHHPRTPRTTLPIQPANNPESPRPARAGGRRALALLVLPALLALAAPPSAVADEMLNKIVLRVNDQIATLYDYQLRRADAIQEVQ